MKKNIRMLALLTIIVAMCLPPTALLAERASLYIHSYMGSVGDLGNGSVCVNFSITGTGTMEDIGATDIFLYERASSNSTWTQVKYYGYHQSGNGNMMGANIGFHSSNVTYAGVSGRQYYALIYFWAGKNNGGDSRSYTTGTITAN